MLTIAAGGLFIQAPAQAQQVQSPPIFESVTLSPKFSPDPMVIRGVSGGSTAAQQVTGRLETATGPCIGFVDEKPDHTLTLTDFFNYLNLQIDSAEDTTLVVNGPGGTWCNDDYKGKNPGIAGQWLAGKYQIWVGSYNKGKYNPYVIRVTEVR